MSEAGDAGARGWPLSRYLLAVALATTAAIGALAWARPSVFTSPLVVAGFGRHLAAPRPDSFYAVRVAPILEEHCVGCHGPRLQRARLRLDSLGDVGLGGKSGRVVVAGDPAASELYTRLLLPKSDRRAMPAGSKPPLPADEIRVIELWIASGANGRTRVAEVANAPPPPAPPVLIETPAAETVARMRAPLEAEVVALGDRYPASIAWTSRASADLSVDAQRLGRSFGDADLARFAPLARAVTRLDLSGTAITDAAPLAMFERLEHLRLNETETGDAVVDALATLRELESVTLIGTRAHPARIDELRRKGVRVHDAR
jgi:mono/diheme cytochrome c family protein